MSLPEKDPEESVIVEFDFSSELPSIDSAIVEIDIHNDVEDINVLAMLDGPPLIINNIVYQRISNGVDNAIYRLRCTATRGDDIIVRSELLPVIEKYSK